MALQGITANFALMAAVAQKLGGIPLLLAEQADFAEHGPDAKATAMCLAHLCSRLLDLSQEDRAAHVMQRLWRQRRHKMPGGASSGHVLLQGLQQQQHRMPGHPLGLLRVTPIAESSVHICCCTRLVAAVAQEAK